MLRVFATQIIVASAATTSSTRDEIGMRAQEREINTPETTEHKQPAITVDSEKDETQSVATTAEPKEEVASVTTKDDSSDGNHGFEALEESSQDAEPDQEQGEYWFSLPDALVNSLPSLPEWPTWFEAEADGTPTEQKAEAESQDTVVADGEDEPLGDAAEQLDSWEDHSYFFKPNFEYFLIKSFSSSFYNN